VMPSWIRNSMIVVFKTGRSPHASSRSKAVGRRDRRLKAAGIWYSA
jgi:hypothetical protein